MIPDTTVVRKEELTVSSRQIGQKGRMTVMILGGTREVDVPRLLQAQPAINDDQAVEMARLAVSTWGARTRRQGQTSTRSRSTRLSNTALVATMIELADMSKADHSGRSSSPSEG